MTREGSGPDSDLIAISPDDPDVAMPETTTEMMSAGPGVAQAPTDVSVPTDLRLSWRRAARGTS